VIEHLVTRGPIPGVREQVLLVEEEEVEGLESRLIVRGFGVRKVTEAAFRDRYGMEAAPAMVVLDAKSRVAYLGGYTDRKQGSDIRDRHVIAEALAGRRAPPLPVLGCAVSRSLQQRVDPLSVKYDR
jgi:hypothetical protein